MGLRKGPKGLQMNFTALLSRENVLLVIDFYLNDIAFTAVKRDPKFYTRYVKGVPFVYRRSTKGVPFL